LRSAAPAESAQIRFPLPDAMAGPAPVSALIHAATMVTAGVTTWWYGATGSLRTPHRKRVVAAIGATTALFAGTIGLRQNDIKKVLAFSRCRSSASCSSPWGAAHAWPASSTS
jgi:NADH-quinone oxidoreductase subunit L